MAISSTEPTLPLAWDLDRLPPDELVRTWKVPADTATAFHAELERKHTDPAWIAQTLARAPAPALAVLALLANAMGMLVEHALLRHAQQQYGLDEETVVAALRVLASDFLVVPLRGQSGPAYAMIAPAARRIAATLAGFELPLVPDGDLPRGPADDGRALLAVCAALRHVDVKLTIEGRPHRAALRKLAKTIGLSEEALDQIIVAGYRARLLALGEDEVLRPVVPRLVAAARLEYGPGSYLESLLAQLAGAPRPVACAAVSRWFAQAARVRSDEMAGLPPELIGRLPGFRGGTLGDVNVLARAPAGGEQAAASITPSFEVFLPPESRATDLVAVLACSELTRVDRAITGRLTKASIGRAVAAGSTGETILGALTEASRTPVPQNVEAAIRDWAGVAPAVVATGRVLVVPGSDADRARTALGKLVRMALAPGVFLLDQTVTPRELTLALGRIGMLCVPAEERDAAFVAEPVTRTATPAAADLPRLAAVAAASTHRARLDAWRRGDLAERAKFAPAPPVVDSELPADVVTALEAWEHRCRVRLSDFVFSLAGSALAMLAPHERAVILRVRTEAQLQSALAQLAETGALGAAARRRAAVETPQRLHLRWDATAIRATIDQAIETGELVAIRQRGGDLVIGPADVIRRGKSVLVLGEDDEGHDVAIPLDQILAVADPASEPPAVATSPWHPAPGQPPPAGHVPCPCGSGQRYRSCCRDAPSA